MGEGGERAPHHGHLPFLPVLWASDLGQALGVAVGVSHGPPELHGQLVRADELRQLLLPVACGDKSGVLWRGVVVRGSTEGSGAKPRERPDVSYTAPLGTNS